VSPVVHDEREAVRVDLLSERDVAGAKMPDLRRTAETLDPDDRVSVRRAEDLTV